MILQFSSVFFTPLYNIQNAVYTYLFPANINVWFSWLNNCREAYWANIEHHKMRCCLPCADYFEILIILFLKSAHPSDCCVFSLGWGTRKKRENFSVIHPPPRVKRGESRLAFVAGVFMREKLPVYGWNHETIFDEKTIGKKFTRLSFFHLPGWCIWTILLHWLHHWNYFAPHQFLFQYFPPLLIKILLSDEQKMCTRKNSDGRGEWIKV